MMFHGGRTVTRYSNSRLSVLLAGIALLGCDRAWSYTPQDPVVQAMVNRGIGYLEAQDWKSNMGRWQDGTKILAGYAHYKVKYDANHPIVRQGIDSAKKVIASLDGGNEGKHATYEVSVSVLLLATVDAKAYDAELRKLQGYLFSVQRSNGPWTYTSEENGDVSQTQYALLAIWTLDRVGIRLDYRRVAGAAQWLLRVQDPTGVWPYHGVDPGRGGLIKQDETSYSMAIAGGSSVLIAGDALRLWGDMAENNTGIFGLPKAVKVYRADENVERRKRATISSGPILAGCERMQAWRDKNPYRRKDGDWYYYQLYTLERYESFIETAYAEPKDKSPAWYNKGVEELKRYQDPKSGGWTDKSGLNSGSIISTSFAVLFLIRSTQKSIAVMGEGTARGGKGFGKDVRNAKLVGGSVKTEPIAQSVDKLLDILDDDNADSLADKSLPEDMQLAEKDPDRAAQLERLERLVRGSKSWQARRVAARLLGKSDEMRVVPALIFALSDPDEMVKRFARDGLRFISRKFEGYGMPDRPTEVQISNAQKEWRAWFLTMRPGYVFIDT